MNDPDKNNQHGIPSNSRRYAMTYRPDWWTTLTITVFEDPESETGWSCLANTDREGLAVSGRHHRTNKELLCEFRTMVDAAVEHMLAGIPPEPSRTRAQRRYGDVELDRLEALPADELTVGQKRALTCSRKRLEAGL